MCLHECKLIFQMESTRKVPWTLANIILLTSLAQLHFAMSAKSRKKFWAPPWPNPGSATEPIIMLLAYSANCTRILLKLFKIGHFAKNL